jgi:hypothetical protein
MMNSLVYLEEYNIIQNRAVWVNRSLEMKL